MAISRSKSIAELVICFLIFSLPLLNYAENPHKADKGQPKSRPGWKLVWSDEFKADGTPDPSKWNYEHGFVRNNELQYYLEENAIVKKGVLVIEGRRERIKNESFNQNGSDYRVTREFAEYTSACLITKNRQHWQYGTFEIRARIDTCLGLWPAIWALGIEKKWPDNGEIDLMEFYRYKGKPTILANTAWGSGEKWKPVWNTQTHDFSAIANGDKKWTKKFHVWKMEWTKDSITISLDGKVLNQTNLARTVNPDGFNPFRQPAYLLLNLAIGGQGGDPSKTKFPVKYEIDYVRVWQKIQ